MYEIWLGLNIFWEMALTRLPMVLGWLLLVVVLAGLALAFARNALCRAFAPALVIGLLTLVAAIFVLPGLTQSSLGEMGYWFDWLTLFGVSAAAGAALALPLWPALALLLRRS